jgi:hypothetical protein
LDSSLRIWIRFPWSTDLWVKIILPEAYDLLNRQLKPGQTAS